MPTDNEETRGSESGRNAIPRATHSGELKLGSATIPCFVLEGGKRVVSQSALITALGMKPGGNPTHRADRLANFAAGKRISPFISKELMARIVSPINFIPHTGGAAGYGYEATFLADLCESILNARAEGTLQKQQEHIAHQAELLVRGLSRVGIIALVDEATGYQAERDRDALAKILEAFIAKELQPYVKTFPPDYYKELFRLRKWKWTEKNLQSRPTLVGELTNNIVYQRLAPGVLEELRKETPRDDKGRLKRKLHQKLTPDVGHPKLRELLVSVVTLMKISPDYATFESHLNKVHTKFGHTLPLDLSRPHQRQEGPGHIDRGLLHVVRSDSYSGTSRTMISTGRSMWAPTRRRRWTAASSLDAPRHTVTFSPDSLRALNPIQCSASSRSPRTSTFARMRSSSSPSGFGGLFASASAKRRSTPSARSVANSATASPEL